jgi:hypothetical protein
MMKGSHLKADNKTIAYRGIKIGANARCAMRRNHPWRMARQAGTGKTATPVTVKERPEHAAFGEGQPCWST